MNDEDRHEVSETGPIVKLDNGREVEVLVDREEEWGVGNRADEEAFATAIVGEHTVDLITGEHPHSRSYDSHYARWKDGEIEGFDGYRSLFDIEITSNNYLKTSGLSGNEVRKGGECKIKVNGKVVHSFFHRDPQRALRKADRMIDRIIAHPVWRGDVGPFQEMVGRKVYWREVPAVVTYWVEGEGSVLIEAEKGHKFVKPPYYDEYDWEPDQEKVVKADLFDNHIWWWRD